MCIHVRTQPPAPCSGSTGVARPVLRSADAARLAWDKTVCICRSKAWRYTRRHNFTSVDRPLGYKRTNFLPAVDDFVAELCWVRQGSYMSTTNVSRPYNNFKSNPLDWQLLYFNWRDSIHTVTCHCLWFSVLLLPHAMSGSGHHCYVGLEGGHFEDVP